MEDLSQKIEALLGSPEGMAKIGSALAAFTGDAAENAAPATPDLSSLLPLLTGGNTSPAATPEPSSLPDLSRLMGVLPLLGNMNQEDDNTALLRALRPHMHGEREQRVEEAIRMMKLMKLLPLLSGLPKGG